MAGCVLRAYGPTFSPKEYLDAFALPNAHAGETHLNVVASEADGASIEPQMADAVAFLKQHAEAVRALVNFAGVETVILDFGLWQKETASQSVFLSPAIVAQAASFGLGLEVSLYEANS